MRTGFAVLCLIDATVVTLGMCLPGEGFLPLWVQALELLFAGACFGAVVVAKP